MQTRSAAEGTEGSQTVSKKQQRDFEQAAALSTIARALSSTSDFDRLLPIILDTVTSLLQSDLAHVMLFDPTSGTLRIVGSKGATQDFLRGMDRFLPDEGLAGRVFSTGEPLVIRDASTDPLITRSAVRDAGLHATACVPLRSGGEVTGILLASTRQSGRELSPELGLLKTIGDMLGLAIENARLIAEKDRSVRLWESTFNAISDGISVHSASLDIVRTNRALERILGKEAGSLIGQPCCLTMLGRDQPLPDCADRMASSGNPCQTTEIVRRPNGQTLRITVDPLLDENQRTFGSVHVVADITEQVRLERHLARTEQLAIVGELAAGLAHEVKNPLAGIKGALEIVREDFDSKDHKQAIFDRVLGEIRRIDSIITDLLDYARPHTQSFTSVDLARVVATSFQIIEAQIDRKRITTSFRSAADLPEVEADPDELQKVVLNLLLNAIHAIKDHGRIEVLTQAGSLANGPAVQLLIKDTGVGIPPENIDKIFKPFFSTKKRGTGLGLSICRRIVTSYGGTIEVTSDLGKGSTLLVTLPIKTNPMRLVDLTRSPTV